MATKKPIGAWIVAGALLVAGLAGCSGDDDDRPPGKTAERVLDSSAEAYVGSFVGQVFGTQAFVAVVAAPAADGKDSGSVQVFVSNGRGLSETFSGPISDGSFVATSDNGDAEAEGTLTTDSVTGTLELPGGKTVRYEATPPSGAAGLYDLTVSSAGELSGASSAGLGVQGRISFGKRGDGVLRLVDGRRLDFSVTRARPGGATPLRPGKVRLIVLSDGELRGVAKGRSPGGGGSHFFLRST